MIPKYVVTWMPEISCFRTPFGSNRVKGSQTLLKSTRQHFYANFSFMSDKVRCVSCLLVGSKMWGASFNALRLMTCVLVIMKMNSHDKSQRNYFQNQKHFLKLLLHFCNVHKILRISKKKMIWRTLIFPEILIPKNVVAWMLDSCSFRIPFGSKLVKGF